MDLRSFPRKTPFVLKFLLVAMLIGALSLLGPMLSVFTGGGNGTGAAMAASLATTQPITAGHYHSLEIAPGDSSLWACGYNVRGQLGLGDIETRLSLTEVQSPDGWLTVSARGNTSLGVSTDGRLWGWGENSYAQLGLGDADHRSVPTQVGTATNWVAVASGLNSTLGLRSDGTLWGWGRNFYGEVGVGDRTMRWVPTQVGTATNWVAIAAGDGQSLALKSDGTLWAWGSNRYGELGLGDYNLRTIPTQVGSDKDWAAVAAGFRHTMAIRSDGTLWAWGSNNYGQLGLGYSSIVCQDTPQQVGTDKNWLRLAGGEWYSLGIRSDGTLWSWGLNNYSQLGLGDTVDRYQPTRVGTATDWSAVAAGRAHSLGLRSNGTLWSWGWNYHGGLGQGDTVDRTVPTQVGSSAPAPTTPPSVSTSSATSITTSAARLNGNLSSLGTASTVNVSFQWGTVSGSYTNETTVQARTSTGTFYFNLSGLNPETTYYYRAKAAGDGTSYGSQVSFTTGAVSTTPPSVSTSSASSITTSAARLNGNLSSLGTASTINVSFQWGTVSGSYTNETTVQARTSTGTFYFNLSGLNPETTYYYRAKAAGDGTSYGSQVSFTTGAVSTTPPSVSTSSASSITTSAARLNGNLSSLGTASTVYVSFQWGTVSGSYTNETTVQARTSTGTFYFNLSGLNPETTYYYRAKAAGDGTSYGSQVSFTTGAVSTTPPSVSTSSATYVTTISARLNGDLTSLGTATSVWVSFYYGTAPGSYTAVTTWQSMTSTGPFSFDLTGLNPATTYYFKARAYSDRVLYYGAEMDFTTGGGSTTPPSVSTSSATYVTTSSARLNGNLLSLGTASTVNVSFQWGTVSGSYTNETPAQARTSTGTFYYDIFDLNPGTTYYFKAKAVGDGTSYGSQVSFSTGAVSTAPPSLSTSSATNITTSSARLNGSLASLGTATTVNVSFQWGTVSGSYTNETTVQARTSTGTFYYDIFDLNPGTTYYYRAKAAGDGTSYGSQVSFTTGAVSTAPPSVSTSSATYVTTNSARLNGSLSSLGTATTVNVSFQWGTVSGSYTNETTVQARTSTGTFYFNLSGLQAGTTYYYRAKAAGDGTSYGSQVSFTTQAESPSQDTTPPTVTVLSPSGGEKYPTGGTAYIKWIAQDDVGVTSVDIYYSTDSGVTFDAVALGQANSGTYTWIVPNTPSNRCSVKVVARDAAGNLGEGVSDGYFHIQYSPQTLRAGATAGIVVAGIGLAGIAAVAARRRMS